MSLLRCVMRWGVAVGLGLALRPAWPAEFYVAPDGKDTDPGTAVKPFASFHRAQEAVRAERARRPAEEVTVIFREGVYPLTRTVSFKPIDSGASAQAPVRYVAEAGKEVVFTGGRRITGWTPDPEQPGVWKARAFQPAARGNAAERFEQLWVNGRRAVRARTPNEMDFNQVHDAMEEALAADPKAALLTVQIKPAELKTLVGLAPEELRDVQAVVLHRWDTTRGWLQSIDVPTGTFTMNGRKMQPQNRMDRLSLYFFENYLRALDEPGEWFLARTGWVFYRPRPGEDLKKADVIAAQLDQFIAVQGSLTQESESVRHLRFEGLTFRYAEFRIPPAGLPPTQAAMNIDAAAVYLEGARDIVFTDCAVEHVGSTGIWFLHACWDCRVERSRFFDMGIAGVRIGGRAVVPEPARTGRITIENCIIQSGGRIVPHAVGVWIGHSGDNLVSHCEISDFFYSGVSVGWCWDYSESLAKRNRIQFNHVHHLGYGVLSDMGGVYTLGPSEGTVVSNNHIHNIDAAVYGGRGLYTDAGSTGILFENNLVHDTKDGGFHQNYGKENIVRNNIFAFAKEKQIALTRAEPHLSFTFERNIVYWDTGNLFGADGWKRGSKVALRENLYWQPDARPREFADKSWEEWRKSGNDRQSTIADPLFVNPARRDFRLRSGSAAEQIGFKPFDTTQAGVYGDPAWLKLAAAVKYPKPFQPAKPPSFALRDNFELGARSPLLAAARLVTEGRTNLIAVVPDPDRARGGHCLRLADAADLKAGFNPHLYWDPEYTEGVTRMRFSIRLEPGARAQCEWRSDAQPYRVGPRLLFRDGALFTGERKLSEIPVDAWVQVELEAEIGSETKSQWDLRLTVPGRRAREFKDLPGNANWRNIRWIGFTSPGPGTAAYYLDDLELENR